jgi:hypothetical protein
MNTTSVDRGNFRRFDEKSLLVEVRDLVSDRALRCELCRRRMRYFPVRGEVVVRCYGRGLGWRCMQCMAGGLVVDSYLSGRGILPMQWLEHWHAIGAAIVIQYNDVSRAYARHRLPLFADALDRLCIQLQLVGEVLADYGDAVALGNVLPFTLRGAHVAGDRQGHERAVSAPALM